MKRAVTVLVLAISFGLGSISSAESGWTVIYNSMAKGLAPSVGVGMELTPLPERVGFHLEGNMKALVEWNFACSDDSDPPGYFNSGGDKRLAPGESFEKTIPAGMSSCWLQVRAIYPGRYIRGLQKVVLIVETKPTD